MDKSIKDRLKEKRKEIKLKTTLRKLENFFASSKYIEFIEYADDSLTTTANCIWKKIIELDSIPNYKISESLSTKDFCTKFKEILDKNEINNEVNLFFGEFAYFPLLKVKILEDRWLKEIWDFGYTELIILDNEKHKTIGILQEEDYFNIYINEC